MDPGALGSLGVGTGFAFAAKLANPDKEVLCYYGDGSFGMTAFDIETADRFGMPFIAVIGNNSAMNQIRYVHCVAATPPPRSCVDCIAATPPPRPSTKQPCGSAYCSRRSRACASRGALGFGRAPRHRL